MTKLATKLRKNTTKSTSRVKFNSNKEDYPEADVIEIPVVKKMVFQFNKPVKLQFS